MDYPFAGLAPCDLKKEMIKEIPMFRVGIKRGEDLDLWLRIALNYDVAYLEPSESLL